MEQIKIKDDVDLKELEKFGFKYNEGFDCWDYTSNFDGHRGLTTYSMIHIYSQGRELYCFMDIGCNESHYTTRRIDIETVLFDLIQAGLVEKVGG